MLGALLNTLYSLPWNIIQITRFYFKKQVRFYFKKLYLYVQDFLHRPTQKKQDQNETCIY